MAAGALVGGSSYRVLIAGDRVVPIRPDSPKDFDPSPGDEDRLDVPGSAEEEKYIPPAAFEIVRDDGDESR